MIDGTDGRVSTRGVAWRERGARAMSVVWVGKKCNARASQPFARTKSRHARGRGRGVVNGGAGRLRYDETKPRRMTCGAVGAFERGRRAGEAAAGSE